MNTETVKIRFLEIGMTSGRARYSAYVDVDSTAGMFEKVIADAVDLDAIPYESSQERQSNPPLDLDIDIGSVAGTVVFAIRLPKAVEVHGKPEESHLVFRSPPFRPLPSNYASEETYITAVGADTNPRWAWFACNLDWIRTESMVAKKIKELHHHSDERRVMRIPFMLNVVDKKLGFAPWMYPPEALPLKSADLGAINTHGGVHPTVGNYVTMDV